jgi:hypothetical protein
MNIALSDDQSLLIEAARQYARAELIERDRRWDEDESSMVEVLPELADMGFCNLIVPVEAGGLGCSYFTYAQIIQALSYASPSVAVALSVHNMVGQILHHYAAEPVRSECLQQWGTPDCFSAFAITEADAGSDPAGSKTTAIRDADGYRLNGEKMWITNGLSARWFVTLARISNSNGLENLSAFLVDGNQEGLQRTKIRGKMGIRGSETAVIHYDNVYCPKSNLLGGEGDGMKVCLSALDGGRIGIASQAVGIARACLDEMVSYSKQRRQFGQAIADFQAIQQMIADSHAELEASTELIARAAQMVDAGRVDPSASAKAKLYASEAANRIAYRAVQVHGGAGYVKECRVEQLARDARITTIYEGTSEIQRIVIARNLLKSVE